MGNLQSKNYIYVRNDLATYRCEFSSNIGCINNFYRDKIDDIEQYDIFDDKLKKMLIIMKKYYYRQFEYGDLITYQFIANDNDASIDPNVSIYFINYPNGWTDDTIMYESIDF